SDRLGRRPVYLLGAVAGGLLAFPFFWLLETGRPALIWVALVLAVTLGHDAMYATQSSFFAELFPTRVRYSGASLASQLGSVFSGGLSPLIATALLGRTGGKSWPVSPGWHDVATEWGIWRAGGVAVPLATSPPPPELEYVIQDADVEILVADAELAPRLETVRAPAAVRRLTTTEALAAHGRLALP